MAYVVTCPEVDRAEELFSPLFYTTTGSSIDNNVESTPYDEFISKGFSSEAITLPATLTTHFWPIWTTTYTRL